MKNRVRNIIPRSLNRLSGIIVKKSHFPNRNELPANVRIWKAVSQPRESILKDSLNWYAWEAQPVRAVPIPKIGSGVPAVTHENRINRN